MLIRCDDCGWIGDFEELTRVKEPRGEFWGNLAYETMYYCPCCGSDCVHDYDPEYDLEEEEEDVQ